MQMHRQSLKAYGAPPRPRGTEVVVRIERCGVCHSDLHMQDGYFLLGDEKKLNVQAGRTLPFTLGHEIAGLVASKTSKRRQLRSGRSRRPPPRRMTFVPEKSSVASS